MKIMKHAQITMFFILAIVIFFSLMVAIGLRNSLTKTEAQIQLASDITIDKTAVQMYVENCLREASEEGLWLLGSQGGFVNPQGAPNYGDNGFEPNINYQGNILPVYTADMNMKYPTLEDIEKRLSQYIIMEFESCIHPNKLKELGLIIEKPSVNYRLVGFDFNQLPVDLDVITNADDVTVKLEYPLKIQYADAKAELKDFQIRLSVRLQALYNAAAAPSKGVLRRIYKDWSDGDIFYVNSINCDIYDPYKQIKVYVKDTDKPHVKVIRIIDFQPLYQRFQKSYMFQFAVSKNPIDIDGAMCSGS
jgi:hypothetical protein